MTRAEKTAFEAGRTAFDRIGDKAMCYDPIMEDLIVDARSKRGMEHNQKIMEAWLIGRGWKHLIEKEKG